MKNSRAGIISCGRVSFLENLLELLLLQLNIFLFAATLLAPAKHQNNHHQQEADESDDDDGFDRDEKKADERDKLA